MAAQYRDEIRALEAM
ncbi:MAG: hypothetical protein KIG91_03500 [Treponema sp.]|nr:hypothetical protein [Treponema sp.]